MDLKTANDIVNPFTNNGFDFVPEVTDDWTFSFSYDGALLLYSVKLNLSLTLVLSAKSFFNDYVFNDKIIINKNKIIGHFSFSKKAIYSSEEFEEAKLILSNITTVDNNSLFDNSIYLDDKGERFIYLGHFGYKKFTNKSFEVKKSKKYIINYPEEGFVRTNNKLIQKTSSRKFVEFVRYLTIDEISELREHLLIYDTFIFIRDAFNTVDIIETSFSQFQSKGFVKFNDTFGFFERSYQRGLTGLNEKRYSFYELDFNTFKDTFLQDMHNGVANSISHYALSSDLDFVFERDIEYKTIQFFCDYI